MKKIYVLFTVILLDTVRPVLGCGPSIEADEGAYKFFNSFFYSDKAYRMLLFCPYAMGTCPNDEEVQETNLMDWIKYLDNKPSLSDTKEIFYTTTKEDLLQLQDVLRGIQPYSLDNPSLLKNSFFQYLKKNKRKDILQYVIYAKEQEQYRKERNYVYYSWYQGENPYSSNNEYSDEEQDHQKLLKEGVELYNSEKDPYLKARYAYQLVRERYLDVYDLKNEFGDWQTEKNYILLRAWEILAGDLYRKGEWLLSQKIFLHVFDELPDRRGVCVRSLSLDDDEQNFNTLLINTDNVPALLFIKSYEYGQSEEVAIQRMLGNQYQDSPYIDILMLRRLSKIEGLLFSSYGYYYSDNDEVNPEEDYSEQLQTFKETLDRVLSVKNKQKDLWQLAKAYTLILMDDYVSAQRLLNTISPKQEYNKLWKDLKTLAKIKEFENNLNEQKIEAIFQEFTVQENPEKEDNILGYMLNVFSKYYWNQNKKALSLLCKNKVDFENNERYALIDLDFISELEALYHKKNKTKLEAFLIGRIKFPKEIDNYFSEMRGTYYLQHYNAQKAYDELKKIPDNFTLKYYSSTRVNFDWEDYDSLGFELYDTSIFSSADRHYFDSSFSERCDNVHLRFDFLTKENVLRNKKDLARLIIELEKKASKNDEKAVYYNYMLGNVWYNMSPEGWFRRILQFQEINSEDYFFFKEDYNSQKAKDYYMKALSLTHDKELKARIIFCLAKLSDTDMDLDKKQYFKKLSDDYKNTNYYREIIEECEYLKYYESYENDY